MSQKARRGSISRAGSSGGTNDGITSLAQFESAPKMNHAELIHSSWVKIDRMNVSLLDAASSYADSRDRIKLEAVYKAFQYGTGKGAGNRPISSRKTK